MPWSRSGARMVARANSKHSPMTGQPAQTRFAARPSSPLPGKNTSGSGTSLQVASCCQPTSTPGGRTRLLRRPVPERSAVTVGLLLLPPRRAAQQPAGADGGPLLGSRRRPSHPLLPALLGAGGMLLLPGPPGLLAPVEPRAQPDPDRAVMAVDHDRFPRP